MPQSGVLINAGLLAPDYFQNSHTSNDFRFDTVQIGSGGAIFAKEQVDFDEVRTGTTFEVVAPPRRRPLTCRGARNFANLQGTPNS